LSSPPALETSQIGLLCYFQPTSSITLANCLPALVEFTQYSNYVDGKVRVWDSHNIGASSPYRGADGESEYFANYSYGDHGDTYEDIYVRIRSDGWMLAWLKRTQNHGRFLWWSDGSTIPRNLPTPTTYGNRLGRALQIIMSVAGISGFAWTGLGYYDYEYPDAKRIFVFGSSAQSVTQWALTTSYYYVTVPGGVPIRRAHMLWIARMGVKPYRDSTSIVCRGAVDGTSIYDYAYSVGASFSYCWIAGGGGSHPGIFDLKSLLTLGIQHEFKVQCGFENYSGNPATYWMVGRHKQAVMVETE